MPVIRFNTIDSNGGSGIFFQWAYSGPVAENNIINNNLYGISHGSSVQMGYNNVWHNNTDYSGSAAAAETDISTDPLYVDYLAASLIADLHLRDVSPCKTAMPRG